MAFGVFHDARNHGFCNALFVNNNLTHRINALCYCHYMTTTQRKIEKILINLGVQKGSEQFENELKNAIAAREFGLTMKEIEKMIEERLEWGVR